MIISWSEGNVLLKRWCLTSDVLNHVTCSGVEVELSCPDVFIKIAINPETILWMTVQNVLDHASNMGILLRWRDMAHWSLSWALQTCLKIREIGKQPHGDAEEDLLGGKPGCNDAVQGISKHRRWPSDRNGKPQMSHSIWKSGVAS